jgi:ABC-type sulfate transport system substrate-binding protein
MSETAATEAEEMSHEDLRDLVENTTRNLCEAFAGVNLMAHLGVASRLVEVVTLDMAHRGYIQEALATLRQLDADIVTLHNAISASVQEDADAPAA